MQTIRDSGVLPELVFGIAGPIGVDIVAICDSLTNALRTVRYEAQIIHLTTEMMNYELRKRISRPKDNNFYTDIEFKIKYANRLCEEFEDAATLARIGMRSIAERRKKLSGARKRLPKASTAYIIRQLKRPDEVNLLRRVYSTDFLEITYSPRRRKDSVHST